MTLYRKKNIHNFTANPDDIVMLPNNSKSFNGLFFARGSTGFDTACGTPQRPLFPHMKYYGGTSVRSNVPLFRCFITFFTVYGC